MKTTIRCITLYQPWATLIASGHKKIETRTWQPYLSQLRPGDRLAIHAGKTFSRDDRMLAQMQPFRRCLQDAYLRGLWSGTELPLGAVVALCTFKEAVPAITLLRDGAVSAQERAFGFFDTGRWGWLLADVRPIEPIPASGKQGVWFWETPESGVTYLDVAQPQQQA